MPRPRRPASVRFNPRPRASGRPTHGVRHCRRVEVSIRARVRAGDVAIVATGAHGSERFNPRPRASGRLRAHPGAVGRAAGFNPRPRASGRRDRRPPSPWARTQFQSAPACERATSMAYRRCRACKRVSIRARVRAGDAASPLGCAVQSRRFNPRPRASGRPASRRGAGPSPASFNPRPRASGRRGRRIAPIGLWRGVAVSIRARVRAGDGWLTRYGVDDPAVSIRARVRAGDEVTLHDRCIMLGFQSAPACERATTCAPIRRRSVSAFQSAPACERATCSLLIYRDLSTRFQSAPACERATGDAICG